jgi:hypothetical protein
MPIIFIAGDLFDPSYQEAKLVADDLVQQDKTLSVEYRALVEDDWLLYVDTKRREYGGRAFEHGTGPLVVHNILGYIGGIEELLVWAASKYNYQDPRGSPEYAQVKQELRKLAEDDFIT